MSHDSLLEVLEGVEGCHDPRPLAGRGGDLLGERGKVLTETVDLGDGEGDTASIVGHLPEREGGGGRERGRVREREGE